MYVGFMKNFFLPIRATYYLFYPFRFLEPKNSSFLISWHHVRRIHEKYLPSDSSQLMRVRLISASWVQKRFIPTLQTSCTSNSWKMFFSPIRANWWVLDSFSPPEPKNVYSYFHDMMYVVFMKNFFSPIRASYWLFYLFRPPEPKNVWFLLL